MLIPDIIIAIDGYSSTGKSTFAKMIASEVSFLYLDSGALYRADVHFEDRGDGSRTYIGDRCVEPAIRSLAVSGKVSPVSAVPEVRRFVDDRLKEFGRRKRVVMDGRDIGTTVFPDAELKIFMVADTLVRAQRRAGEMAARGEKVDLEEVLRNIEERDYIDSHRETSPLSRAEDAIVLDNSRMTLEEQMEWFRQLVSEKFPLKS